jgi:hypothetical protein
VGFTNGPQAMNPRFWVLTVVAIAVLIVIAAVVLAPAIAGLLKGIYGAGKIQLKSARGILRSRDDT